MHGIDQFKIFRLLLGKLYKGGSTLIAWIYKTRIIINEHLRFHGRCIISFVAELEFFEKFELRMWISQQVWKGMYWLIKAECMKSHLIEVEFLYEFHWYNTHKISEIYVYIAILRFLFVCSFKTKCTTLKRCILKSEQQQVKMYTRKKTTYEPGYNNFYKFLTF